MWSDDDSRRLVVDDGDEVVAMCQEGAGSRSTNGTGLRFTLT